MSRKKPAAQAFLALGSQLAEAERAVSKLPLGPEERVRARRMAAAARESLAEAMTSVGRYLGHVEALGGRS